MYRIIFTISIVLILSAISFAENGYKYSPETLSEQVYILADDSLEGREIGEIGEYKAALYIASVFEKAGLNKLDNSYFQQYDFIKRIEPVAGKNILTLNDIQLNLSEDYTPLKQSASISFENGNIIDINYGVQFNSHGTNYDDFDGKDVSGKFVLVKRGAPSDESKPHIDFEQFSTINDKINNAIKAEASGIIFYTPEGEDDSFEQDIEGNMYAKDIPILFVNHNGLNKAGINLTDPKINYVSGQVELERVVDSSQNVIGYLRGKTDTIVVIGAHYDHIGYGGKNSRYKGEEKLVHNGADDNASGVASLLELAKYYSAQPEKLNYSLLFISFGGEEFGLIGSRYFIKHPTIDLSKVRMMINMDMIGRLDEQENRLAVLGVGTTDEFQKYFDTVKVDGLNFSLKQSGMGPSDHTVFYNSDIPVIHFFTGAHEDYNTPNDDADLIDYDGIYKVTNLVSGIIDDFDKLGKPLPFKKTKDSSAGKHRSKYSVSLGIMPDYVAEGVGVNVDGVVEDRPGEKAGIVKGDVIIKIGEYPIDDIYDYMSALGKFKKGDSTEIVVLRDSQEVKLKVQF